MVFLWVIFLTMLLYYVYKVVVLLDKEILKGSIDILLLSIIAKRDTYATK